MSVDSLLETYSQEKLFDLANSIYYNDEIQEEICKVINKKIKESNQFSEDLKNDNTKLLIKYCEETADIWLNCISKKADPGIIYDLIEKFNSRKTFSVWFPMLKDRIMKSIFSNTDKVLQDLLAHCSHLVDIWGKELDGIIPDQYGCESAVNLFSMYVSELPDKIEYWFPIFRKHECIKTIVLGLNVENLKEIQMEYFLKEENES